MLKRSLQRNIYDELKPILCPFDPTALWTKRIARWKAQCDFETPANCLAANLVENIEENRKLKPCIIVSWIKTVSSGWITDRRMHELVTDIGKCACGCGHKQDEFEHYLICSHLREAFRKCTGYTASNPEHMMSLTKTSPREVIINCCLLFVAHSIQQRAKANRIPIGSIENLEANVRERVRFLRGHCRRTGNILNSIMFERYVRRRVDENGKFIQSEDSHMPPPHAFASISSAQSHQQIHSITPPNQCTQHSDPDSDSSSYYSESSESEEPEDAQSVLFPTSPRAETQNKDQCSQRIIDLSTPTSSPLPHMKRNTDDAWSQALSFHGPSQRNKEDAWSQPSHSTDPPRILGHPSVLIPHLLATQPLTPFYQSHPPTSTFTPRLPGTLLLAH